MDYLDVKNIKDMVVYAANNFDNPRDYQARDRAAAVAKKYDLSAEDLNAYRSASWLPPQQSNPVKARVLDKVWQKEYALDPGSDVGPTTVGERFSIKTFIDEDPDLQVKYLQRKNYNARYNTETNEVEAARPGEPFQPVDPSHIGLEDALDVVGELVQGAIEGLVTSFGGYWVPAIGAGTAAALETGKQQSAMALGLRDDYNTDRIATKAALGGVFPLLPLAMGGTFKGGRKINAAEIKHAGEEMGAKPTLGMLTNDRKISYLENARWNQPRTMFNEGLQNQIENNIKATDEYAESLFSGKVKIDTPEAGAAIRDSLTDKLKQRLDRANALYSKVENRLNSPGYQAATNNLYATLDNMERKGMYANGAAADEQFLFWVNKKRQELDNVGTIGDLKKFNTNLMSDSKSFLMSNPMIAGSAKELRGEGKKAIDQSFNLILDNLEAAAKNPKNKASMPINEIRQLRNDFREANNLYRQINYDADAIMKRPGAQSKGSANTKIGKIEGASVEEVFRKIYSGRDIEKARWLTENYPNEAALARGSILDDIFTKADQVRKGANNGQSFGSAVSQRIRNLNPSEKEILFGSEGKQKAEHLATWFANQPFEVNASGSSSRSAYTELIPALTNYFGTSPLSAFQYFMARVQTKIPKAHLPIIGEQNLINNPITRGASVQIGNSWLVPNQSTSEQYSFP